MSLVQKTAPEFKGTAVIGHEFKDISNNYFKGKWIVLFFYPLDFTFVCPSEIIAFNNRLKEFKLRKAEVIAVSVDSHFTRSSPSSLSRAVAFAFGICGMASR